MVSEFGARMLLIKDERCFKAQTGAVKSRITARCRVGTMLLVPEDETK